MQVDAPSSICELGVLCIYSLSLLLKFTLSRLPEV